MEFLSWSAHWYTRMQTGLESGGGGRPLPSQRGTLLEPPAPPSPDAQTLPVQPEGTEAISPHIPDRTVTGELQENSAPKLLTFFYFHKSPYNRSVGG